MGLAFLMKRDLDGTRLPFYKWNQDELAKKSQDWDGTGHNRKGQEAGREWLF